MILSIWHGLSWAHSCFCFTWDDQRSTVFRWHMESLILTSVCYYIDKYAFIYYLLIIWDDLRVNETVCCQTNSISIFGVVRCLFFPCVVLTLFAFLCLSCWSDSSWIQTQHTHVAFVTVSFPGRQRGGTRPSLFSSVWPQSYNDRPVTDR